HFGRVPANWKRDAPYIEGPVGQLLPPPPYSTSGFAQGAPEAIGTFPAAGNPTRGDSLFPEYQDAYGTPRPIIYLRANNNAVGICTPMGQKAPATLQQYTTYEFNYYMRGRVDPS